MTVQEIINAVMLKATGKATELASDNAKWQKILGMINFYQKAWANEPGQEWSSLYDRAHSLGMIAEQDTYDIDDEVARISTARGDSIYVLVDGKKIPFDLVAYDDLANYPTGNYCAVIGKTLVFNRTFTEDSPEYGGQIYAPIYREIEEVKKPNDDIVVDDPIWLVTICAAEYVRNDIVKQNQYGNLIAEANNLMTGMIQRNRGSQIKRIRGEWRNPGGEY